MNRITVLLFGHYRDIAPATQALELPAPTTIAAAAATLAEREPRLRQLLQRTRVALNGEFASADSPLNDGDEVAFLPPMSGG